MFLARAALSLTPVARRLTLHPPSRRRTTSSSDLYDHSPFKPDYPAGDFSRNRTEGDEGGTRVHNLATKWVQYNLPYSDIVIEIEEAVDIDGFLEKAIQEDSIEPFGVVTWASSFLAVERLDFIYGSSSSSQRLAGPNRNMSLSGKVVVDLGCGTGLSSVTALALGASRVISLDLNQDSLFFTERAMKRFLDTRGRQQLLCDNQITATTLFDVTDNSHRLPSCNLLVVSDLLYYPELATAAAGRVIEALEQGADVLVTDPGRTTRRVFAESLVLSLRESVRKSRQSDSDPSDSTLNNAVRRRIERILCSLEEFHPQEKMFTEHNSTSSLNSLNEGRALEGFSFLLS